jgi:hypothetical protein
VTGATSTLLRVRSLNGEEGFLPLSAEWADSRREDFVLAERRRVRDIVSGDTIAVLETGATVTRIADIGGGEVVRLSSGRVAVLTPVR